MKRSSGSKNRFLAGMSVVAVIFIISVSCTKSMSDMYGNNNGNTGGNTGTPGANEVWIQGMEFTPSMITVKAGTTITWTNKDGLSHTVTGGGLNSGTLASGLTYTHTFATVGTYFYACSFHPSMTGSVVVN